MGQIIHGSPRRDIPLSRGVQSSTLVSEVAALNAAAAHDGSPAARVRLEIVRRWAMGDGGPVELCQADLARHCRCSLRTVQRVFASLRAIVVNGARLMVEAVRRRIAPRLTEAGEWESSPKRWALNPRAAFAALGWIPPAPDEPKRAKRAGQSIPPSVSGSIGNVRIKNVPAPLGLVDNPYMGPTAAGRAIIATIRKAQWSP